MNGMGFAADGPSGSLWMAAAATLFVALLMLAWLFISVTHAIRGDTVEKPNRMAQFYGFTVCLLAIVVGLVTISSIIGTMFDRANPLESNGDFGQSLTSFDAFKATANSPFAVTRRTDSTRVVTDSSLRVEYESRVRDRLAHVRYETSKDLVTNVLLLLVAIALFGVHWRWLRRTNGTVPA